MLRFAPVERIPLDQLLTRTVSDLDSLESRNQMDIFDQRWDTTVLPYRFHAEIGQSLVQRKTLVARAVTRR
jgi:hypothetical protein